MAELILAKIEPPLDRDRISYDEAKAANLVIIGDGLVPKVPAIQPQLVPGMWHVEMRSHGLSLGAVADRFASRNEAKEWAKLAYPCTPGHEQYGGYGPSCIYTPTEDDLQMLAAAPKWLDVVCYMVKISPVGSTNWKDERFEKWASKREALQRVASFQGSEFNAKLDSLMRVFFSRCVEDIKNRAECLKTINGDRSKLVDGSIWDTPHWRKQCSARMRLDCDQPEPKSWDLYLYVDPQLRTFYSEFYSAKRILATPIKRPGFRSEQDAVIEGLRILATSKDYTAMSVWHSDLPAN